MKNYYFNTLLHFIFRFFRFFRFYYSNKFEFLKQGHSLIKKKRNHPLVMFIIIIMIILLYYNLKKCKAKLNTKVNTSSFVRFVYKKIEPKTK